MDASRGLVGIGFVGDLVDVIAIDPAIAVDRLGAVAAGVVPATPLDTIAGIPSETAIATAVGLVVTASLPFYLYGAWIVIDTEVVTWSVLLHHLRYVGLGLVLTTVPVVTWMAPQLLRGFSGLTAIHTFFGLQAYALLLFGLTGIYHIVQAKRRHSLYADPDQDVALSDLHEKADAWRFRLRVGVFGYLLTWLLAWLLGLIVLFLRYEGLVF